MTRITQPKVIRSRRKSVALQVMPDATLVVKVPWYYPPTAIESILREKADWIKKTTERVQARTQLTTKRSFTTGETLLYLGTSYPLTVQQITQRPVELKDNTFLLNAFNIKNAKLYLTNWYKRQASLIIEQRVAYYAQKHDLSYGTISLSSATTRWGSCTHDNNLFFNWTLIMAPLPVLDYVIVHELAHTLEKNHSFRFWHKVAKMQPEYRTHRRWLKEQGHTLTI